MKNIKLDVKKNVLTIIINLDGKREDSKSGKTEIIASTQGNVSVPGRESIKLGVNVYESK